jgi:hypothetical protein
MIGLADVTIRAPNEVASVPAGEPYALGTRFGRKPRLGGWKIMKKPRRTPCGRGSL